MEQPIQSGLPRMISSLLRFVPSAIAGSRHPRSHSDTDDSEIVRVERREEIACGGTALIYRAVYSNGWSEVEKILLPKFQGRPEYEALQDRELEILSHLSHPLILRPFRSKNRAALGRPNQTTQIVYFEHVEGVPLSSLLDFVRTLSPSERRSWAHEILAQLATILSYLKERGVVHGDLAPENIMVQPSGLIKLVDFGVAKSEIYRTLPFRVEGREHYRAPELLDTGATSFEGDVYALGRIFVDILGDDLAERPIHRRIVDKLLHQRSLDGVGSRKAKSLFYSRLDPLPPRDLLIQKGTIKKKTLLIHHSNSHFREMREKVLRLAAAGVFLFSLPFISSWTPYRARITVNTLPYSIVTIRDSTGRELARLDTPVRDFTVPPGDFTVQLLVPAQKDRIIQKNYSLKAGDHAKFISTL